MSELINCPHCGQEIMKGAMRCPSCSKILKTAEEQLASVERASQKEDQSIVGPIIKWTVIIVIIAAAYRYKDELLEILGKLY